MRVMRPAGFISTIKDTETPGVLRRAIAPYWFQVYGGLPQTISIDSVWKLVLSCRRAIGACRVSLLGSLTYATWSVYSAGTTISSIAITHFGRRSSIKRDVVPRLELNS